MTDADRVRRAVRTAAERGFCSLLAALMLGLAGPASAAPASAAVSAEPELPWLKGRPVTAIAPSTP